MKSWNFNIIITVCIFYFIYANKQLYAWNAASHIAITRVALNNGNAGEASYLDAYVNLPDNWPSKVLTADGFCKGIVTPYFAWSHNLLTGYGWDMPEITNEDPADDMAYLLKKWNTQVI